MNADTHQKTSDVKISQALELLNEAAREKKDEVKALLSDKYSHLRTAVVENAGQAVGKAEEFIHEGRERIKESAVIADKRVRENPWPYIAGTAIASIFVGYLMGSKHK